MSNADPLESLRKAVELVGSQSAMARLLGISQAAVWKWLHDQKPLPAEHVIAVEERTGISRHALRPDIYPIARGTPILHVDKPASGTRHRLGPERAK